jgi:hypothetical protein
MNNKPMTLNLTMAAASIAMQRRFDNAYFGSEESSYPLVSDLYGRNIIVPLTLKGKADTMYFPEAVVNISRERNIVATPVLNGKGTVKEMITEGDLSLSISLAVVSTSDDGGYDGNSTSFADVYPGKGVERLRKLLDEPNRLDIVSGFLTLFDLDGGDFGIVVKSYSLNQQTHTNRQVFEIQALSDYDYDLLIES